MREQGKCTKSIPLISLRFELIHVILAHVLIEQRVCKFPLQITSLTQPWPCIHPLYAAASPTLSISVMKVGWYVANVLVRIGTGYRAHVRLTQLILDSS